MSKFRHKYRELTDAEKAGVDAIKIAAETLDAALQKHSPPGRYLALANTTLEEAVMWAVKGITG